MSEILQLRGPEIIAEVLEALPQAQEIFAAHGLSCAGCHINVYETIEQGVLGHGMNSDDLSQILEDLNAAAQEFNVPAERTIKNPYLTEAAKDKVLEFQEAQGTPGYGFKIEVLESGGEDSYFLDFLSEPEKGDKVIESLEVRLFLSPESLRRLQNCEIDFGANETGDVGFKIDKVQ